MSRPVIDAVDLDEGLVALTGSEITYEDHEVALAGYGLVVEHTHTHTHLRKADENDDDDCGECREPARGAGLER